MTLEQLIAEVAKAPTQVEAFTVLMNCLKIEMNDASSGDSPPPSVQGKYDSVFSSAIGKAHEILHAIETGKPALESVSVAAKPAFDVGGPHTPPPPSAVFVDKPATAVPVKPSAATPLPDNSTTLPYPPTTPFHFKDPAKTDPAQPPAPSFHVNDPAKTEPVV
jgi:hypothetical protein